MSSLILKADRECNDCTVCCYVAEIPFENHTKPPHKKCLHVLNDRGNSPGRCGVYGKDCRPDVCNKFMCAWYRGYGNEEDRPDLSGVMLNIYNLNGGVYIFVIEVEEGSVLGKGKNIILDMVKKYDYPAIVTSYGVEPPHDTGNMVILKDSLLTRAKRIMGEKIADLTEGVSLYNLINSGG